MKYFFKRGISSNREYLFVENSNKSFDEIFLNVHDTEFSFRNSKILQEDFNNHSFVNSNLDNFKKYSGEVYYTTKNVTIANILNTIENMEANKNTPAAYEVRKKRSVLFY